MCTDQEILFLVQISKAKIMCLCELIPVECAHRPPEGLHRLMLADGSVLQGPALPASVTSCRMDSTEKRKKKNNGSTGNQWAVELEVQKASWSTSCTVPKNIFTEKALKLCVAMGTQQTCESTHTDRNMHYSRLWSSTVRGGSVLPVWGTWMIISDHH